MEKHPRRIPLPPGYQVQQAAGPHTSMSWHVLAEWRMSAVWQNNLFLTSSVTSACCWCCCCLGADRCKAPLKTYQHPSSLTTCSLSRSAERLRDLPQEPSPYHGAWQHACWRRLMAEMMLQWPIFSSVMALGFGGLLRWGWPLFGPALGTLPCLSFSLMCGASLASLGWQRW